MVRLFFRFLYLFQQLGNLPPHPTGQHGVDGNGKSRRFHVATLLHSRHATTNGCHDSFTAILHHRTRLVLYRQRSIARSLFRLPENHYETDRGSYHSFIATSYLRHFPKHDGERASHERNHHVPESDNCNICPACLAAAYPVHCCWQREWKNPLRLLKTCFRLMQPHWGHSPQPPPSL